MPLHPSLRSNTRKRGGALVASLIVAMVLAGLGAGLVQVQTAVARRAAASLERSRALYVAEAGLSEAFLALRQGRSGVIGSAEAPCQLGTGLVWVEAEPGEDGTLALRSTGIVGRSSASVQATCFPEVSPLGRLGLFGEESVTLEPGSRAAAGTAPARITSNGDLAVASTQGGARVEGDVVLGPTALLEVGPGSRIEGEVRDLAEPFEWPAIDLPLLPEMDLSGLAELADPMLGPGGLSAPALTIGQATTVRLVGPLILVVDELSMSPGGRLEVDASNGPVIVHVLTSTQLSPGSHWEHLGGTASAVTLLLHHASTPLLRTQGTLRGAIVAPQAAVSLGSGFRLEGTVAARQLTLESGSRVTATHETEQAIAGMPSEPLLLAWQFTDTPDAPCLGHATAPLRWLQLNGVSTAQASTEALAQRVTLQFVQADGTLGTWTGTAGDAPEIASPLVLQQTWEEAWQDTSFEDSAEDNDAEGEADEDDSDGDDAHGPPSASRGHGPASPRGIEECDDEDSPDDREDDHDDRDHDEDEDHDD